MYYRTDRFSLFLCVACLVTVCGRVDYCLWLFYSSAGWVFGGLNSLLSEQRKKGKKEISILNKSGYPTGCCPQCPQVVVSNRTL
jgi:hypothetical protein